MYTYSESERVHVSVCACVRACVRVLVYHVNGMTDNYFLIMGHAITCSNIN